VIEILILERLIPVTNDNNHQQIFHFRRCSCIVLRKVLNIGSTKRQRNVVLAKMTGNAPNRYGKPRSMVVVGIK
jgi:hypothetical protein